jgi:aryl-alcohol dehydrogenase-like predicted oxidoreductase
LFVTFHQLKVSPPEDSRVAAVEKGTKPKLQSNPSYSQFADDEKVWALLAVMEEISSEEKRSVPTIALKWCLQRPTVSAVVIGVRTPAQLDDNLGAADDEWTLPEAAMIRLNSASIPVVPYPYEMVWRVSARGAARQDGNLWPISRF